jgi:hypothetical protein
VPEYILAIGFLAPSFVEPYLTLIAVLA